MAQLRFTESAERDLVDIGNFIARDSPASAARFIARLEEHCDLLAAHPLSIPSASPPCGRRTKRNGQRDKFIDRVGTRSKIHFDRGKLEQKEACL
jgi:plasmid stabilization system protein ParE